jgi:valyl-tRNA synthetase
VLNSTLALAHPVIPFVTEEIWSYVPGNEGLLAGGRTPSVDETLIDEDAEERLARVIGAVTALRGWRDTVGAPARAVIPARFDAPGYDGTLHQVARLARFDLDGAGDEPVASVVIPEGVVHVLPSEALDLEAAAQRREQARARLEAELTRAEGKLANPGFVDKAPVHVVQAERDKARRLREELDAL